MFLSTLWLKSDGIITGFISAKTNADEGIQSILKDNRGHSTPTKKKNAKIIKEHISSYQPKVSHYASEKSPNRRYLDSCLTVKSMGCDFQLKHENVTYQLYFQVFQSENIGFSRPNQDECDMNLV